MNQFAERPNPAAVPTLTEVIELLSPTPVGDVGMHAAPRSAPPAAGSAEGAPIVTGGLASSQPPSNWTPMTTVVVPTLNEVALPPAAIDLPVLRAVVAPTALQPASHVAPAAPAVQVIRPVAPVLAAAPAQPGAVPVVPDISEAQLTQRVLSVVQKQVDSMIEFRLKEAMGPILARHTDALVRELREELARTMGDVVARSVTQEMAKLRQR
jgi:hypothetical protein